MESGGQSFDGSNAANYIEIALGDVAKCPVGAIGNGRHAVDAEARSYLQYAPSPKEIAVDGVHETNGPIDPIPCMTLPEGQQVLIGERESGVRR